MKRIILLLAIVTSVSCFSQTEYYSTDGKNRLTKKELDNATSDIKVKYKKILGKEVFVNVKPELLEKKKDSIIYKVSFGVDTSSTPQKDPLLDKVLPQTILKDINGEKISLADIKGKPTLINFWFTSCAPCIEEIPVLNNFYKKYKDDYNFIAITFEAKEKVDKFLKKHPYKFRQIVGAKEFIDKLRLSTYPTSIFLDKDGVVRSIKNGIPYISGENGMKMGDGLEFIETLEKLK